jgi:hypothetical protein
MRTFTLVRLNDVSGISGTGVVAEGVEFSSGNVVITWFGDKPSVVIWESILHAMEVHCHNGNTLLRFNGYDLTLDSGMIKRINGRASVAA